MTRQQSSMTSPAAASSRREHDLLGERDVPAQAYYGIQTLRARENFQLTGVPLGHFPRLVVALAMVKKAAAQANAELGRLPDAIAVAIDTACDDIIAGELHDQFVVDMVQGGAGTSTNMNANEVIANRALEKLGLSRGSYDHVHPNNHVNCSQSTNDAYPTAIRVAILISYTELVAAIEQLCAQFQSKADAFASVLKIGRTQLQDAVPMTLGQEFAAYAATLREEIPRIECAAALLREVNLGGTAIGTGLNADPRYAELAVRRLGEVSGLDLESAADLLEATADTGAFVTFSSTLKRTAVKLSKICNDLRLLSSGPRAGLGEIALPAMQPGSSIMPGKVNPVIPEAVNQIAYMVIGNDTAITMAAEAGQLQLNVMEPVIVYRLFESLQTLTRGVGLLAQGCVAGITANEKRCREFLDRSIGVVTALNACLGYEQASRLAQMALESNRDIAELAITEGLLTRAEVIELLAPEKMTNAG